MKDPVSSYWTRRLEDVREALEANDFEASVAQAVEDVRRIALSEVLPALSPRTVGFGDSMTVVNSGLYQAFREFPGLELQDIFEKDITLAEKEERRHRALATDLFVTGTNAVTEDGRLVNLDRIGNRVAGITYGPKHVLLVVGRNKIAPDLDSAVRRVKEYAAPLNCIRLSKKTPCVKTARCMDCKSPDRICNVWTIVEKCFPKGRIKVILVNADLGL